MFYYRGQKVYELTYRHDYGLGVALKYQNKLEIVYLNLRKICQYLEWKEK